MKALPKFITPGKAVRLYDHARRPKYKIMIRLMFELALRINELCQLRIRDIDQDNLTILVTGKKGKQRILPLNEAQWSLIIDCLQMWKPRVFLFEDDHNKAYGTRQVRQIVYDAAAAAGIGHVYPHMLRHSRATEIINAGIDISWLKEFLGHAFLSSTEVYTHLNVQGLRNVLQNANLS